MKETLILIPGLGANELLWKHQSHHLKDIVEPKVMVLDQHESRSAMVDAVLKNAPDRFLLAGHSMGGWIAQEVAAKAPERVSKLVLLSTWSRPDIKLFSLEKAVLARIENNEFEQALMEHLPRLVEPSRLKDPELMQTLKLMLNNASSMSYARQIHAMQHEGMHATDLSNISSPTLIIYGRQDGLFSLDEQFSMKKALKNSKLAIIEECGHLAPLERPQATTALMRLWLSQ